ncbi:MAG: hypothetical protein JNJ71_12480 [Rubrivivax sp.]|nr:hypothetical protein [Rubrivivax sp.]
MTSQLSSIRAFLPAFVAPKSAPGRRRTRGLVRPLAWVMVPLAGLLLAAAAQAAAAPVAEPLPGEYRVTGGRVDSGTFTGWRIFHTSCHGCHGVGGIGTDVAPNLVQRIKGYTPRGFATKVLTSYRIVPGAADSQPDERAAEREALLEQILKRERNARGQVVMPAWEEDSRVPPHVLDLYAYLSARADGVVGMGRPQVVPPRKR